MLVVQASPFCWSGTSNSKNTCFYRKSNGLCLPIFTQTTYFRITFFLSLDQGNCTNSTSLNHQAWTTSQKHQPFPTLCNPSHTDYAMWWTLRGWCPAATHLLDVPVITQSLLASSCRLSPLTVSLTVHPAVSRDQPKVGQGLALLVRTHLELQCQSRLNKISHFTWQMFTRTLSSFLIFGKFLPDVCFDFQVQMKH